MPNIYEEYEKLVSESNNLFLLLENLVRAANQVKCIGGNPVIASSFWEAFISAKSYLERKI